ncbi:hypothetical protein [Methanococcus voltae]|uniref:Uncharacterized protein n=1 Tax=Methanococcus voltae (strain ATCC BAA-1334 / A3) TaxID=456320 RepID=D7DQR6_METV3|nr:hypothetical protein [Methanococcus voltae]MCS3900853.1 hypothetical protein [Methanococcus voltae]
MEMGATELTILRYAMLRYKEGNPKFGLSDILNNLKIREDQFEGAKELLEFSIALLHTQEYQLLNPGIMVIPDSNEEKIQKNYLEWYEISEKGIEYYEKIIEEKPEYKI